MSNQLCRLHEDFVKQGIALTITKKSVKNVNFRIKAGECFVSVPKWISDDAIIKAIYARLAWAVLANQKLQQKQAISLDKMQTLWGVYADLPNDKTGVLDIYRHALNDKIPYLMDKWEPIVGRSANQIRLKKMKTRWGTCNTHDARIWLSVYLAAYPYECTEYVFVHELCHLIHANHSPLFWAEIKKAMPDYKTWHGLLGCGGNL